MYLTNLRNRHFFLLDGLILCLTPLLAILLRLDRIDVPHDFLHGLLIYTAVSLVVRLITFYQLGLYRRFWQYASIDELSQIVNAVLISTLFVWLLVTGIRALLPVAMPMLARLLMAMWSMPNSPK